LVWDADRYRLVKQAKILVVGGGIAGLAFGAAACRLGLNVRIVERLREVSAGAAGIGLHLNAQRALESIGVGDAIHAVSWHMDGYFVRRRDGKEVLVQALADAWGAPTWAVHRAELSSVLRRATPSACLSLGVDVIDVQFGDGAIATFSDASRAEFDLVVGADGVRSTVRRTLFGGGFVEYGGTCFWRTTLTRQVVQHATGLVGPAKSLGLIPLVGDRTHFAAQLRSPVPIEDPQTGRRARLIERIAPLGPLAEEALDLITGDTDIHFSPIEWVRPPAWGEGRAILIGDAAHSMAPTLALGGAMAIEDAVVLAEELAATHDVDLAIDRFKARRDPRVAFVQERTRIALERIGGARFDDEPADPVAFDRRNYVPLLEPP
jgi:2-polyprenyl-6-methoxyphenol hydroxylase-like FAD-dependent oxidoreductase